MATSNKTPEIFSPLTGVDPSQPAIAPFVGLEVPDGEVTAPISEDELTRNLDVMLRFASGEDSETDKVVPEVKYAAQTLLTEYFEALAQIAELKHDAIHDPLSGALNRRGFYEQGAEMLDTMKTGSVAVMFSADLDGFKTVNDTHGHHVGDQFIREAGRVLGGALNNTIVGRPGGDEFELLSVINPEDLSEDETVDEHVASSLAHLRGITEAALENCSVGGVGISIGKSKIYEREQALRTSNGELIDTMRVESDQKMYDDKQSKRPGTHTVRATPRTN